MKKVIKIVRLLMMDIFLCYIVAGNVPLIYYIFKGASLEDVYKEKGGGFGGGDASSVIFLAALFFLFLILFLFDILFTIVAIRKGERGIIWRNSIVFVIIGCIDYFRLRLFYTAALMIPSYMQEQFKLRCSIIAIIFSIVVLAIYI